MICGRHGPSSGGYAGQPSQFTFVAYVNAYDGYVYAYDAMVTGGGSYAAFYYAFYGFEYAYLAYYYNAIADYPDSLMYAGLSSDYSYLAAVQAYDDFAISGGTSTYSFYAYYFSYYNYLYSSYVAQGF